MKTELDNMKYRDNITQDIEIVRFRINKAATEKETNDRFGMAHTGTMSAFLRVRRDLLDLAIGDKKIIRECDTSTRAVKNAKTWNAALDEIAKLNPDDVTDLRVSRNSFGRDSYKRKPGAMNA